MNSQNTENRLSRRHVLGWFAAAAATEGLALPSFGQSVQPATKGYGQDPVLNKNYEPGEVWPLLFSAKEKKAATALADVILPKDEFGPAASEVRVPDFVDEWISAPYPRQEGDRGVIIPGLKKLDEECRKHFQKDFADLGAAQKTAVCDEMAKGDYFFHLFTLIASGAYYSTQEGWQAIGYKGNTPTVTFDGPPKEVLDRLGLEQTVE
ncbi:MAG: gluconate 2-dehydrogenase subunit 3 family protein [Verrucomicrobiaceae bacterium]